MIAPTTIKPTPIAITIVKRGERSVIVPCIFASKSSVISPVQFMIKVGKNNIDLFSVVCSRFSPLLFLPLFISQFSHSEFCVIVSLYIFVLFFKIKRRKRLFHKALKKRFYVFFFVSAGNFVSFACIFAKKFHIAKVKRENPFFPTHKALSRN